MTVGSAPSDRVLESLAILGWPHAATNSLRRLVRGVFGVRIMTSMYRADARTLLRGATNHRPTKNVVRVMAVLPVVTKFIPQE